MNKMSNDFDKKTMLNQPIKVVNIGLRSFNDALEKQGVLAVHLEWRPPAGGDPKLLSILEKMANEAYVTRINKANQITVDRIMAGTPVLEDVARAIDCIPGMTENTILHAGPPLAWGDMPPAMKGAIVAALLFEKKVSTPQEAVEYIQGGAIHFSPCHEHDAVGAMSGITTASMPVFIVRNKEFNNVAFCTWRDMGQASGSYTSQVIEKMDWLKNTAMPAMRAALKMRGGFEIKPLLAQGLLMGDEHHNRVIADTSNFTRSMAPMLVRAVKDNKAAAEVLDYFANFDLAIVPIIMAACKSILMAADSIEYSTVVTAIARNGFMDAIRVSGLPGRWFMGPAPKVDGIYHSGFSQKDAALVMGDSPIIECAGFGGLSIAASPAHVTVRDNPGDAEKYTRDMYAITLAKNPSYPIPALGFEGIPVAIDIRFVVESGILPISNNPAAHKDPDKYTGVIGFGMSRPPMGAFKDALKAYSEKYLEK